jgi:hypothetical protein
VKNDYINHDPIEKTKEMTRDVVKGEENVNGLLEC